MKKEKMNKNKIAAAIALLLMLTLPTIFVALPVTNAQESNTYRMQTFPIIEVNHNPIGVGQEVLIFLGISEFLETYDQGWEGLTVTVTLPNGESDTLGPFRTDSTGLTGAVYVPTMSGTYKLQTNFPEQTTMWNTTQRYHPNSLINKTIVMEASHSEIFELVVQEDPIPGYPGHPLPEEYWTRPINGQLREWSTIGGNWLDGAYRDGGFVAPYNTEAPETAHMLWTKELQMGGIVGGELGDIPVAFEDGDAYEGFWESSIIIGGVLFYNQFKAQHPTKTVVAVDLHTGEEKWRGSLTDSTGKTHRLAFGQTLFWDSFNYHGVFPYLWAKSGTSWHAFDPNDGSWVYSMENVPSGFNSQTPIRGPKGEIMIYSLNLNNGWMTVWNSTYVVSSRPRGSDDGSWLAGEMGKIFDARKGIQMNVTIPKGLTGSVEGAFVGEMVFGGNREFNPAKVRFWAISLEPGKEGQLIFDKTWKSPVADVTPYFSRTGRTNNPSISLELGIFTIYVCELRQHWGFSLKTGEQIWGPTEPQKNMDYLRSSNARYQIFDGKLFAAMQSGTVYAYNASTGNLLWTYDAADQYKEVLWGTNWPMKIAFFADDKMYLGFSEHSPLTPKFRDAPFICLDVDTGDEIWKAHGLFHQVDWGGYAIIADNIIATLDSYDQQICAIGKGPSSISVIAPSIGVKLDSSVLLTGTVTDKSPGTEADSIRLRFPDGVPAVADEDQSEWMKYVYKQFERPANVTGVDVMLYVLDANGNYREIGTTKTDANGFYSFVWVPDIPGKFTVIARFTGSNSYYPSSAETAFVVDEAEFTVAPTNPPASIADQYFILGIGIVVAAIAIGFAVTIIVLKKKP